MHWGGSVKCSLLSFVVAQAAVRRWTSETFTFGGSSGKYNFSQTGKESEERLRTELQKSREQKVEAITEDQGIHAGHD